MIASANSLYDTRRRSCSRPAMVREPTGASTVSTDAIPAPSGPEPSGDNDELRKLGERIAELAARINSAEARMMTLIAEFDRRGGWKDGGYSSCAEWLAWRTGTKIGTARERVRTARALERLPQTADALKHGTISYAKVRALTRVATPEREAELLEFARAGSAAKLERTVRMLKKLSRDAELTAEQARRRSRAFSVFVDGDGMYVVKGRLEPEAGAVLMRAVEAASDALFRRESDARDAAGSGRGVGCEAERCAPGAEAAPGGCGGLLAERRWPRASVPPPIATQAGQSRMPSHRRRHPSTKNGRHPTAKNGPHPMAKDRCHPTAKNGYHPTAKGGRHPTAKARLHPTAIRRLHPASGPVPEPSATRSWSIATRRRLRPRASRDARIWTGFAFPRRRPGAWRAMRRWSRWSTRRTARC